MSVDAVSAPPVGLLGTSEGGTTKASRGLVLLTSMLTPEHLKNHNRVLQFVCGAVDLFLSRRR